MGKCAAPKGFILAEEVGFEPTVDFHLRRFSRPVHSTTLPLLRQGEAYLPLSDSKSEEFTREGAHAAEMQLPLFSRADDVFRLPTNPGGTLNEQSGSKDPKSKNLGA